MNLLITGSCGHIGSYVAENVHKIKKIKKTFLVDNIKSNSFCSLFNLKKNNNLKFYLRNVDEQNSLNDFKNNGLDSIRNQKYWSIPKNYSHEIENYNHLDERLEKLLIKSVNAMFSDIFKLSNRAPY